MVRLRNAVMAIVLATGMTGCAALHGEGNWFAHWSIFHCDSCDDFPAPSYGPGYSLAPGSYTGPATSGATDSGQPAASTPPANAAPSTTPPATITTPPTPPNAAPGPGAGAQ
jgi:hypothetical protein